MRRTAAGVVGVAAAVMLSAGCGGASTPSGALPAESNHPASPSSSAAGQSATPTPTRTPVRVACPPPTSGAITHAPGRGKTVALTFDDGPGGVTPQVGAVLRRHGVRATFFDVGSRAAQFAGEERALAADGHLIADHTWEHHYPRDSPWTVSYLTDQMRRTDATIAANTGASPCFFRPPGGIRTNVAAAAGARHLTVALWSLDTLDWKQPTTTTAAAVDAIVARATTDPGPHPVVLMHVAKASTEPENTVHAYRGNTVAALPRIIQWYRAHGYQFVDLAGGSGLR